MRESRIKISLNQTGIGNAELNHDKKIDLLGFPLRTS